VKKTLYVHRRLLNAETLANWAYDAGIQNIVPAKDMHVTVCFSRTPMQWPDEKMSESLTIVPFDRELALFNNDALVLKIKSPSLYERHMQFKNMGASYDYPTYQPHVTLAYGSQNPDVLRHVYTGFLHFGGEIFKEVNPKLLSQVAKNL
jgi:2'-5' RNA ligase